MKIEIETAQPGPRFTLRSKQKKGLNMLNHKLDLPVNTLSAL